ncbi:unnamed protein product [Arabis nemorensis]|uniref:Uncharacterized protein n=1 Tax=Arabis nemorensis TaxID=586526 RepID=A0A565ASQ9_9BRAS|nr:unnamed protein product [Arabis nemorensis]
MDEGVSTLTFLMSRESESASRLKSLITDMIPHFSDDYYGDVLSVCYDNRKGRSRKLNGG